MDEPIKLILLKDDLKESRIQAINDREKSQDDKITFEDACERIELISKAILDIEEELSIHNSRTMVEFRDQQISLKRAIRTARFYKAEISSLERLSYADTHNFNKDEIRGAIKGIRQHCRRLGYLIHHANVSTKTGLEINKYEYLKR